MARPMYQAIYPNQVYMKKDGSSLHLHSVVIPKRFVLSKQDDVVNYLQARVRAIQSGRGQSALSQLDKVINSLPQPVLSDIQNGSQNCINFIRANTPVTNYSGICDIFFIRFGIIPQESITQNQATGNLQGAEWYEKALLHPYLVSRNYGVRWKMHILLSNGALPSRRDILTLLRHGVHMSKTLKFSTNDVPHEAREVVDLLYSEFPTPEHLQASGDVTEEALEELVLMPVLALHKMVKEDSSQ